MRLSTLFLLLFLSGWQTAGCTDLASPFSEFRLTMEYGRGQVNPSSYNADLQRFAGYFQEEELEEWILPTGLALPPLKWLNLLAFSLETDLTSHIHLRLSCDFGEASDVTIAQWARGPLTDGTGYLKRTDTFSTFHALGMIKYYPPMSTRHDLLYLGAGAGLGWLGANGSINYTNIFPGDDNGSWFAVIHRYSEAILAATACIGLEYIILEQGLLYLEAGGVLSDFGQVPGRSDFEVFSASTEALLSGEFRGDRPESADFFEYSQPPASGYSGEYISFDMSHYYLKVGIGVIL
ncbi:MAG: hypothetical protein ISR91_00630 [Candidatus Delongbacteria bacterium]|nr:hypothetical protein [Candidatus Delongbacteria bacterium]